MTMTQGATAGSPQGIENELCLLEALAATPETTQIDLATRVGLAVGTVNWYLKRWSQKGYVKVQRVGRWNWRYLLTADGIARKRQLTYEYVDASFTLYRRVRVQAKHLLNEVMQRGQSQVVLIGENDIIEVCRLTCLELRLNAIHVNSVDVLQTENLYSLQWQHSYLQREWDVESEARHHPSSEKKGRIPVIEVEGSNLVLKWPPCSDLSQALPNL